MKSFIFQLGRWGGMMVATAMLLLVAGCDNSNLSSAPASSKNGRLASANTNSTVEVSFISCFDRNHGVDPFTLVKSDPEIKLSEVSPKNVLAGVSGAPGVFQLKSIAGSDTRRVAFVNSCTFVKGDEKMVQTTNGLVRVRCLAIGANSITLTYLAGDELRTNQLFLKK
jgi:hypothetical protein